MKIQINQIHYESVLFLFLPRIHIWRKLQKLPES